MEAAEAVVAVARNNPLTALTAAALSLPGVLPVTQAAQVEKQIKSEFQFGRYEESSDRITVDIYQGNFIIPIAKHLQAKADWTVDTFSGATPVLTMPNSVAQVTTGASGINGVDGSKTVTSNEQAIQVMTGASTRETRYGANLGLSYFIDDLSFHASGSRSKEPDYLSHGYHLGIDWEFNQKLNTLSIGFGQNFDRVEPTTRSLIEHKTDHHVQLDFSQILSKESLLRLSANYTHNDGFLSNPYKKVFIQNLNTDSGLVNGGFDKVYYENRPGNRNQWSVSLGLIHYISWSDAALHLDYRYFTDNWGIDSHAFEAIVHQPLGNGWMVIPRVRYYSQTAAEFFQPFYSAPRSDNHYSSDFRLAGFGTLSGGLKLTKEWQRINELTESIKLEAGVEYSTHAANLQLGGQTASDITDLNYVLFTGALKISF
jgi:uncharacterized protein DUF3570